MAQEMNDEKNSAFLGEQNRICSYEEIPLFLGAIDIAKLLGLSMTNVYYMLRADDFPTIVIGKRRLVRKEKLLEWISAHEKNV